MITSISTKRNTTFPSNSRTHSMQVQNNGMHIKFLLFWPTEPAAVIVHIQPLYCPSAGQYCIGSQLLLAYALQEVRMHS